MTFDQFSRVAQEAFQSFPEAYREGIEGVTTVEAVEAHPELPGMVTLGECITQAYNSDWQSPETTRSRVVLYYGSFLRMEQDDPDFSWEGELRETLTHELQHHLESLAGEDALEAMDYATDEGFKRERDDPFDPLYFQWGEPMGEGMYRVEDEVYIERVLTAAEVDHLEEIDFTWEGQAYRIPRPDELGDVHFVVVEGIDTYIQIVLIRQASWRRRLRAHVRSEGPVVLESGAEARRVAPNGDEVGRHDTGDLQEHSRLRVVLTSDAFRALQVSQAPPLNSRCLDISVYLQHPHILALFDSGEADSFLCYGER